MDDIAIKVTNVSKGFNRPRNRSRSVKGALLSLGRGGGYDRQQVLDDISFEIKKGEFFGIVGRNGSGKSTMLKLLAGIYTPDVGEVTINGKLTPFIELGVGFNPELTGRENVYLSAALLGFNRKDMEAMYDDIVEFAELEQFMEQKLKNYSSGMQVRLAFSIAIRAETDILLIDEVLAVGDQSFQEKCFDYFAEVKKSNKTVVFVTHDMSNVERFCDRVYVIDKKSSVNGMYTIPEAVALYNQLNHEHEEKDVAGADEPGRPTRNKVWIEKVTLMGSNGKPTDKLQLGDPLTVDVELGCEPGAAALGIVVGMAFHNKDNTNLAGPNSEKYKLKAGDKHVTYQLDRVPFNMGEYYLTVVVYDDKLGKLYDLHNKETTFFVNARETHHGLTVLDGAWATGKGSKRKKGAA